MTSNTAAEPRSVRAESRSGDYLHTCLARHGELSTQLFGQRQDLEQVEATTKGIRSSRSLTYDDIERIKGQESWKGGRFWLWPSRADIGDDLENQSWDLWNLPENEDAAIERLLKLFRRHCQVEASSRF